MSSASPAKANTASATLEKLGLSYWMQSVLEQCDHVRRDFAADPVHDLRVALRRCRSLADGTMAIDPAPEWRQMKKAGRKLFQCLGELRDMQVMTEWIEKLADPGDATGTMLAAYAAAREHQFKQDALLALEEFDRKRWRHWSEILPKRLARLHPESPVFRHMALERWTEARALHTQAMRNRSRVSFHRLRIGIKRLRYTVENFLPRLHDLWIDDLKQLQDWLGEVHDLDVLWEVAVANKAFAEHDALVHWRTKIAAERQSRIENYREKMLGRDSLWQVWRAELPQGSEIQAAALQRLKLWASFSDPDFRHSQRVTRLSLQLHDGLSRLQDGPLLPEKDSRLILQLAALLHEVGRVKGAKNHHKKTARMVRELKTPLGLDPKLLQVASIVARYHRGALPNPQHTVLARLSKSLKGTILMLAGILRLANAFDAKHDGQIRRVIPKKQNSHFVVLAQGYSPQGPLAERIASARHLLELTCRRPVMVAALRGKA